MPFIRLSDNYIDHPKFLALSASAFRLWHEGMAFCRKHQTDGLIPLNALSGFRYYKSPRATELATPYRSGIAPLWETIEGFGFKVHDYLEWNLSKDDEDQQREEAKQRMALGRDPEIRRVLRERDGYHCRYCARTVSWTDRRGPGGATYDHVQPNGGDGLENLVVACRGCNSRKGKRTPEEAGMTLLPPARTDVIDQDLRRPSESVSKSHLDVSRSGSDRIGTEEEKVLIPKRGSGGKPPPSMGAGVFAGSLPRDHARHAACGRVCLQETQFQEFVRLFGGTPSEATKAVRRWATDILEEWDRAPKLSQPIGGNRFQFWQARWTEWHPPASAEPPSTDAVWAAIAAKGPSRDR